MAALLQPPPLPWSGWLLVLLAALLVGFSKTAIAGVGSIAVALFAMALPARESTGAILTLLICGDLFAVARYRRHTDWTTIARLAPGLVPGLVLGWLFLRWADDEATRFAIGVILLVLTGLQVLQRRRSTTAAAAPPAAVSLPTALAGTAAGFTTMTANSSGPIVTLYLIGRGMKMVTMLGTMAWLFLLVNLAKVPFSVQLGLISADSLRMTLWLLPAVALGAWLGAALIRRMDQRQFENAALALGAVAAGLLLV